MNLSLQIIEALALMERAKVAFMFQGRSANARKNSPLVGGTPVYISSTLTQAVALHQENFGGPGRGAARCVVVVVVLVVFRKCAPRRSRLLRLEFPVVLSDGFPNGLSR